MDSKKRKVGGGEDDLLFWEVGSDVKQAMKELTVRLIELARDAGVKLPNDVAPARVASLQAISASRTEDGKIDAKKALGALQKKYGVEKGRTAAAILKDEDAEKDSDGEDGADNDTDAKKKKRKKAAERKKSDAKVPANQELVDAFVEVASFYFKMKESQKAFTYRKLATAIAALEYECTSEHLPAKKGEGKVPGIGEKGILSIKQFVETGTFDKLEQIRAEVNAG